MDGWKSRGGKSQRGEEKKWEDPKRQVKEKQGKSRFTVFFQWSVAPEGWKVGSLKRRVRSHVVRWEMKNCTRFWKSKKLKHLTFGPLLEVEMLKKCTPMWREAHFQVKSIKTAGLGALFKLTCRKSARCCGREAHFQVPKMHKTHHCQTTFGSWNIAKSARRCGARSTFSTQKCQKLTVSDHFWTSRCRKSARRCGAKHIWKSKVWKTVGFEPLLRFRCAKSAH